jgi:prepilin-type N-terminal cleavage/methylation domain-containing protein
MKHARPLRFAGARGFTLVESIVVLVVLSIAAAAIISLQGNIFYGQSGNKDLQVGVQLMQECTEQILATRRQSGYSTTPSCSGLTTYGGYNLPTVTVTNPYTGAGCPSGGTCKSVEIKLTKSGVSLTPVTLMLVSY